MVRYMQAWFFRSREHYEHLQHENVHCLDNHGCRSGVDGEQGYDLGEFNEYEEPLDTLIEAFRNLTQKAATVQHYLQLKYLAWIISDCLECGMHFVVISNF